jgi:prepilin-type N-terminal cleavage/methylation domain-containing protein/prepilin-type processing-associated H-X9-DG protein
MSRKNRAAFTLIELLVVVAIIALLIAMLLPSLARAREISRRTVCLANLHGINTGLHVYASQSEDQVPLGVDWDPCDWDYGAQDMRETSFLYWGNQNFGGGHVNPSFNGDFLGLGRLYEVGAVTAQKMYYCPSALANGALPPAFAIPHGQWPPEDVRNEANLYPDGYNIPGEGWPAAYSGYSRRPAPPANDATWGSPTVSAWRVYVPGGPPYDVVPEATGGYGARFPKIGELATMAVVSDLAGGQAYVNAVHKDGMNVAYADGAARWVPVNDMKDPTTGVSNLSTAPFNYASWGYSDVANSSVPLWQDFDRN